MTDLYVNKFDHNKECALQGQKAERSFKDILISEGHSVREATRDEQMKHVDLVTTKDNKVTKYEIKARKKINRGDDDYQNRLIWVEFINVIGDVGWLYGAADKVSFESEKDFIVVDRLKLAAMAESKCNPFKRVNSASEALYKGYQRKGRKDIVSLVKESDIREIADRTINK